MVGRRLGLGIFLHKDSLTPPLSGHFGQNEIIADSESTPFKTSKKVISDGLNVYSFKVMQV